MRQIFLLLSILLLGLSWAVAQDTTSVQTSRTGAGGQMTVEACLSGSNGNFTLTDKNGMSYQLTVDTAKLTEHVGHEIKVTGTSESAGAGASGSTEPSGTASSASGGHALQVTSVKHISKSCKSGGMSH